MRRRATSITHRSGERGVALILTLAILALVTLLLIAFVTSMRVENAASKNFNELIKARELAQAGVDEAVGVIRTATPPVSTVTNYVTAPGVIYTWSPNILSSTHWTNVALFTTDPANPNGVIPTASNLLVTNEVDLNKNFVITGSGTVYNANSSPPNSGIWVGWSNVVATVNGASQLVGRYAYWVDDESAKVNLNVAGTRGNDLEGWTPAAIDLQPLFGPGYGVPGPGYQVAITNYVSQFRPFDTIESLRMGPPQMPTAPGIPDALYSNNQFFVTVHSTSPDITPWGTKRMNLTDVVNTNTPADAVALIASALSDENFALSTGLGGTFSNKYPNVQQIAANIYDYIRGSGSGQIPTDSAGSGASSWSNTNTPAYLGLRQTPYLNQLVVSNSFVVITNSSGAFLYMTNTVYAELWYMYTNQVWQASPYKPEVYIANMPSISVSGFGFVTPSPGTIASSRFPSYMATGTYAVVSNAVSALVSTLMVRLSSSDTFNNSVVITPHSGTIVAILRANGEGRLDYAQIPVSQTTLIIKPSNFMQTTNAYWAAQCNDPRAKLTTGPVVSGQASDWGTMSSLSVLGGPSGALNMSQGNGTIPGDGDTSCHIISGSNQRGTTYPGMYPGELAFIHTGVPWRTFWLQPEPSAEVSAGYPPDWAILDLFSATDVTDVVGRISINQVITNSVPTLDRFSLNGGPCPLSALLANPGTVTALASTKYSLANAGSSTYNYYINDSTHRVVASLPGAFSPYSYTMVGEIANTPNLSNFGTPPSPVKSVLETPVRDIANIITTRSNTFTIWCLAQSVKKVDKASPAAFINGTDVVTGEAKVQAIVERTVVNNSSGTPQVKFRTLYYRYYYQ